MKRAIAIFLCAALLLSGLCGCEQEQTAYVPTGDALDTDDVAVTSPQSTDPAGEGDSTVSLVYDREDSMNPFQATGYTNRALFSLIYQGLFSVSRDYTVSPVLCRSYNISADKKTYTFYVENASFSDGTPLAASDVTASLKAAMDSPWYGNRLQHVASISDYGDAVVIELDTPMEDLPTLLDIPVVKASETESAQPLGTGPYQLAGTQLRRQAGWWCTASLPVDADTIELVAVESASQIRDAFEFDNVSMVCTDPADQNYVDFHSDYELWDCESGLFLYLVCNNKSAFFSNATLRSALTYAIDRETLSVDYYHGFASAASLPASPESPYYSNALANAYAYNPQKFKKALNEAGVTGGSIKLLLCSDDPLRLRVGKAIAAMLEEYGLEVTIVESSGTDFAYLLTKGDYDLYLAQTKLSANMDLSAFFGTKTGLNYGGLSDPATYAICLEALADTDNYYTLHEMVMDAGYLCPILFQNCAVYVQRGVFTDLEPARDNVFQYDLGRTLADAYVSENG